MLVIYRITVVPYVSRRWACTSSFPRSFIWNWKCITPCMGFQLSSVAETMDNRKMDWNSLPPSEMGLSTEPRSRIKTISTNEFKFEKERTSTTTTFGSQSAHRSSGRQNRTFGRRCLDVSLSSGKQTCKHLNIVPERARSRVKFSCTIHLDEVVGNLMTYRTNFNILKTKSGEETEQSFQKEIGCGLW